MRDIAERITRADAQRSLLQGSVAQMQADIERLTALGIAEEEAQCLFQAVAAETQEQVKIHIQDIVQAALDAVFPQTYSFRLEYEFKRGKTETAIYLDKDGERINPMDSSGGGVVDIVAFALRLAAWSLSKSRPTLLMDEPFRFVSKGLRPVVGEIVKGLADRLGIQLIVVTHDETLINSADRVLTVTQTNRRSVVR